MEHGAVMALVLETWSGAVPQQAEQLARHHRAKHRKLVAFTDRRPRLVQGLRDFFGAGRVGVRVETFIDC